MGKKRSPEEAQERHNKHMETLKHLNKLREEIIKKIEGDTCLTFKKMDHTQKLKELGSYFKSNTRGFDITTKVDDVVIHFKESVKSASFLFKTDLR